MYVHFILPGITYPLAMLRAIASACYHHLARRVMIDPSPSRSTSPNPGKLIYQRREDAVCALITRLEADIICESKFFARCCQARPPRLRELADARQRLNRHLSQAQAICSVHGLNLEIMGRESFIHRLFDAVDKANEALDETTHYLDSL